MKSSLDSARGDSEATLPDLRSDHYASPRRAAIMLHCIDMLMSLRYHSFMRKCKEYRYMHYWHHGGRSPGAPEHVQRHPFGKRYPLPPSSHFFVASMTDLTPATGTSFWRAKIKACRAFRLRSEFVVLAKIPRNSSLGRGRWVDGDARGMIRGARTSLHQP